MKRLVSFLCAGVMLLGLCACGKTAEPEATPVPVSSNAAAESSARPGTAPVLSPGAAEQAYLSGFFQTTGDGTVYTSLARGEGVACLYDSLPEDIGAVGGFFLTDDGIYAVIKESSYSMEPAALYFFPSDGGESLLLAEDVFPSGLFCLAGDGLFYTSYADSAIWRLDIPTGETRQVLDASVYFLGAQGGFIYYTRDGGLYRNDSLMSSEVMLVESGGIFGFLPDADCLCLLVSGETPAVEIREPDGTLRARVELEEYIDTILRHGDRVYVPLTGAGTVLVLDLAGNETARLPLPGGGGYYLFFYAGDSELFYETYDGERTVICAMNPDTGGNRILGERILY